MYGHQSGEILFGYTVRAKRLNDSPWVCYLVGVVKFVSLKDLKRYADWEFCTCYIGVLVYKF